jgi:hypothetical protein
MWVGHVHPSSANCQVTIFQISVGDCVRNPWIESIEVWQWSTIAAQVQVVFVRAWYTMTSMKTIIHIIHLPLKCRHVKDQICSGLNQSLGFPHTTNYESGRHSPHLCERESQYLIIDRYRLHMCHDNRQNSWMGCLGVVFCAKDEDSLVVNKELISPRISRFPCNQLLNGFVCILRLLNLVFSEWIQSFWHWIEYVLRCLRCRLVFILIRLRDNIDLLTLRMEGLEWNRSELRYRNLFSKCCCEAMSLWPHANCFPGWSLKRLVIRF